MQPHIIWYYMHYYPELFQGELPAWFVITSLTTLIIATIIGAILIYRFTKV